MLAPEGRGLPRILSQPKRYRQAPTAPCHPPLLSQRADNDASINVEPKRSGFHDVLKRDIMTLLFHEKQKNRTCFFFMCLWPFCFVLLLLHVVYLFSHSLDLIRCTISNFFRKLLVHAVSWRLKVLIRVDPVSLRPMSCIFGARWVQHSPRSSRVFVRVF